MGGILACDEDKDAIEATHKEFCTRWEITGPLRSHNIRKKRGNFGWLASDESRCARFMTELTDFICGLPILALACVIDRRGYDLRYRPRYEHREMWWMCRTSFCIAVPGKFVSGAFVLCVRLCVHVYQAESARPCGFAPSTWSGIPLPDGPAPIRSW
jgi:hypothetical protein